MTTITKVVGYCFFIRRRMSLLWAAHTNPVNTSTTTIPPRIMLKGLRNLQYKRKDRLDQQEEQQTEEEEERQGTVWMSITNSYLTGRKAQTLADGGAKTTQAVGFPLKWSGHFTYRPTLFFFFFRMTVTFAVIAVWYFLMARRVITEFFRYLTLMCIQ